MRQTLLAIVMAALGGCSDTSTPAVEPSSYEEPAAWTAAAGGMPVSLRAKFEAVPGTVHVLPIDPNVAEENRFHGSDLGAEDRPYLGDHLALMAEHSTVFACVEADGGLFVLRTPSSEPDRTDLVLAAWSDRHGGLAWIADLAWSACDDEGCTRQESWLTDLDGDSLPEIVSRSSWIDGATGVDEISWSGFAVAPDLELTPFDVDRALMGALVAGSQ